MRVQRVPSCLMPQHCPRTGGQLGSLCEPLGVRAPSGVEGDGLFCLSFPGALGGVTRLMGSWVVLACVCCALLLCGMRFSFSTSSDGALLSLPALLVPGRALSCGTSSHGYGCLLCTSVWMLAGVRLVGCWLGAGLCEESCCFGSADKKAGGRGGRRCGSMSWSYRAGAGAVPLTRGSGNGLGGGAVEVDAARCARYGGSDTAVDADFAAL